MSGRPNNPNNICTVINESVNIPIIECVCDILVSFETHPQSFSDKMTKNDIHAIIPTKTLKVE